MLKRPYKSNMKLAAEVQEQARRPWRSSSAPSSSCCGGGKCALVSQLSVGAAGAAGRTAVVENEAAAEKKVALTNYNDERVHCFIPLYFGSFRLVCASLSRSVLFSRHDDGGSGPGRDEL